MEHIKANLGRLGSFTERAVTNMNYYQYIKSDLWKQKKAKFYASKYFKNGRFCMCCKTKNVPLEVHHKTYKRLFKERLSDLFAVCRTCHELIHQIHKTRKSIKNNLWSATYLAKKQHLGKTPTK